MFRDCRNQELSEGSSLPAGGRCSWLRRPAGDSARRFRGADSRAAGDGRAAISRSRSRRERAHELRSLPRRSRSLSAFRWRSGAQCGTVGEIAVRPISLEAWAAQHGVASRYSRRSHRRILQRHPEESSGRSGSPVQYSENPHRHGGSVRVRSSAARGSPARGRTNACCSSERAMWPSPRECSRAPANLRRFLRYACRDPPQRFSRRRLTRHPPVRPVEQADAGIPPPSTEDRGYPSSRRENRSNLPSPARRGSSTRWRISADQLLRQSETNRARDYKDVNNAESKG